jgi:hypothetical protein
MAEHDAMQCRACGREERASEGYPCHGCGTFICQICDMKGVTLCRACQDKQGANSTEAVRPAAPA